MMELLVQKILLFHCAVNEAFQCTVVLLYSFVHIAQAIFFDPITIIKNSHTAAIYRDRAPAWKEGWKERRNESLKGVHLGSRWVFSLLSFRLQHLRPSDSNVSHQYCPPYTTECAQYCIMQKASDRWVACNMIWHSIHLSRHFCKNWLTSFVQVHEKFAYTQAHGMIWSNHKYSY